MTQPSLGFELRRHLVTRPATAPVVDYRTDALADPVDGRIEIAGPGYGMRFLRHGSHSFETFSELAKTLVHPGMSDLEKAIAVYRFSSRNFHGFTMGWGATEMTRFINAFGYSYCWGQADFQHLLYEACGLKARAPLVKGHSTVEVLIDGEWRLMDAFMRLLVPAGELDGIATGEEMHKVPDRWDSYREGGVVAQARDYWSQHKPANTYEPWQNSRSMMLNLRRGERLAIDYASGTTPAMAAYDADDYLNGTWSWTPTFDEKHLASEIDLHDNATAAAGELRPTDAGKPATVEYRINSIYPLITGSLSLAFAGTTKAEVSISTDNRRTWSPLDNSDATIALDKHLTPGEIPPTTDVASSQLQPRYEAIVRIRWSKAAMRQAAFRFVIQAHRPSVPRIERGVNQWRFVGGETGASIAHAWDEFPGLRVSNTNPNEGEAVTIEADVHNRAATPALNAPVRLIDTATNATLASTTLARIEPGKSATASFIWKARRTLRTRRNRPDIQHPYLRTRLRVIAGDAPAHGPGFNQGSLDSMADATPDITTPATADGKHVTLATTNAADAVLIVKPTPIVKFNDALVWSSDARDADHETVALRAAVIHLQGSDDAPLLYPIDAGLDVTLTPYLGHPDRGGLRLANPAKLRDIAPFEFGTAEWRLATHALPREFEVWVEARADQPVAAGMQRLLAKRTVRLDAVR